MDRIKKARACPICNRNNSSPLFSMKLRGFDSSSHPLESNLAECLHCGFVFNDQLANIESLSLFYSDTNFYFTESSFGTGGADWARYEKYLSSLQPFTNTNFRIADIGCGKGGFIKFLIGRGFDGSCGVELDKRLISIAKEDNIPVLEGKASKLPFTDSSFDLLFYTHVFEHLWDLDDSIQEARRCLRDEGLIFIEVPNASSYSAARVFDFYWLAMAEHINHFNRFFLEALMTRHGFECVLSIEDIVPYNNPNFGYPSLRMLFKKSKSRTLVYQCFSHKKALADPIREHIAEEERRISFRKKTLDRFAASSDVYFWGIGMEFFILASSTNILNCNIAALLDKNTVKHSLTVDGFSVLPPEHLRDVSDDALVGLTSIFHKNEMLAFLKGISFKGKVISLC